MRSRPAPETVRAVDVVVQADGAARLKRLTDPDDVTALLALLDRLEARRDAREPAAPLPAPS
jgi:hypothetical protein